MYLYSKYDFALKLFTVTFQNKTQMEQHLTRNLMRGLSGWRGFPRRSLSALSSIISTYKAEGGFQFHFTLKMPEPFKYNLLIFEIQLSPAASTSVTIHTILLCSHYPLLKFQFQGKRTESNTDLRTESNQ